MARLLIAEDEPMIARVLADKLQREGHTVVVAVSCAEAERTIAAEPPDLALVDRTLEDDGLRWAAATLPRAVPWLAMVGTRDADGPAVAAECGAAGLIVKPFKPTAVAAAVAALLGGVVA